MGGEGVLQEVGRSLSPIAAPSRVSPADAESNRRSFGEMLQSAFDAVNQAQWEAEQAATLLATGDITDVHQVMIATEKANIALQLTISIRNQVINAYQEISRMQI